MHNNINFKIQWTLPHKQRLIQYTNMLEVCNLYLKHNTINMRDGIQMFSKQKGFRQWTTKLRDLGLIHKTGEIERQISIYNPMYARIPVYTVLDRAGLEQFRKDVEDKKDMLEVSLGS